MEVTSLLVSTLLHEDVAVRTAAASLAFNVAAYLQKGRIDGVKGGVSGADSADGDWEVELISAVVEAIDREKSGEEIGQRIMLFFVLMFQSIDKLVCPQSIDLQPVWHSCYVSHPSMRINLRLCLRFCRLD